jgi:hypothetical protein
MVNAVAIAINVFGIVIVMVGLTVTVMNARRPAPRKAAAVMNAGSRATRKTAAFLNAARQAPPKEADVRLTVVRPAVPSLDEQPSVHPAPLVRASGDYVLSGGQRAA